MRNNLLKKIVGLFVLLCSFTIRAQLPNGSFETNCGTNSYFGGTCTTFASGCIPGWFITHGTPQLITSNGSDGMASVSMWASEGRGEGIGVNLNSPLIPGEQYKLCFAYRVNNPDELSPANLFVHLKSGLTHHNPLSCGEVLIVGSSQEVGIIDITESTSGWVSATVVFTPNTNYSQIIVFPYTDATPTTAPVTVIVDDFQLSPPCTSTLTINQTSPSVSGTFNQRAVIRAGSHVGGSTTTGYVTVDQVGLTTFSATKYVSLEDNFLAIPGAADEVFQAIIQECNNSCHVLLPKQSNVDAIPPFPPNTDWDIIKGTGTMTLFPNPASGQITVYSPQGLKSGALNDVSGRTVMVFQPVMNETKQTFKLSNIQAGIYILTLTDNSGKVETKKLVIE